jgi:nitroreductase
VIEPPPLGVVVPVGAGGARQLVVAKDAGFHRGGCPMVACASLRSAAITEDAMPDDTITADLFEIIRTTRSMRRLKPDPVPDASLRRILEAGVCAPSGGNMQRWRFLVVKDAAVKATIGALYKRAWDEQVGPRYRAGELPPGTSREQFLRMLGAAEYLAAHIHEAPVWIVPCLEGGTPTRTSGSSIYPAVQNMLLAARALGLGATLTTLYLAHEKEAEVALGLPPGVHLCAAADRLPDGPVRAGPARLAERCRVRGQVGSAVRNCPIGSLAPGQSASSRLRQSKTASTQRCNWSGWFW